MYVYINIHVLLCFMCVLYVYVSCCSNFFVFVAL